MTKILSSLSIYRPTYLFSPTALPIVPATGLQSDSPLSSCSHTVWTAIMTPSASQFRLLYLFKGTVRLQPSKDPSLSTQMMANHILHSQQHNMESPVSWFWPSCTPGMSHAPCWKVPFALFLCLLRQLPLPDDSAPPWLPIRTSSCSQLLLFFFSLFFPHLSSCEFYQVSSQVTFHVKFRLS